MTDISPTSAYLSDSEMIAWLQAKENDQYGKLREQMDSSSKRSDLTKDLTDLRASLDNNADPAKASQEMQTIIEKYKGTPEDAEVERLLLPAMAKLVAALPPDAQAGSSEFISNTLATSPLTDEEKQSIDAARAISNGMAAVTSFTGASNEAINSVTSKLAQPTLKELSDKVKSKTDELGRIDQLALINIQQVMADARQTDQLTSNIMSSRDQASNSIVGNIRG